MTAIICDVCPRSCRLEEGKTGFCGVRRNVNGENRDALYGRLRTDFQLGRVFATFPGCNLQCPYCLYPRDSRAGSHMLDDSQYPVLLPEELVDLAAAMNAPAITLSGGEPTLHHEYLLEASRFCREESMKTIMLTNGYLAPWLVEKLADSVDLVVVGVKGGLSVRHYGEMNADPSIVRQSIKIFWERAEATIIAYLVDLGFKSTREDDRQFATWLCQNADPNMRIDLEYLHAPSSAVMSYPLPKSPERTWGFILEVAATLRQNGLTNIRATDVPTFERHGIPRQISLC